MGFMELEISGPDNWLVVETRGHGSTVIPADLVNLSFREPDNTPIDTLDDESSLREVAEYVEGEPQSIEIKRGTFAWRLSAPGYMDQTEWSLAKSEAQAFRDACDMHDDICRECGATDSTDREDGMPFCLSCVAADADIVDTAQSATGDHDITDGHAILVSFGDLGDVIVSARYTRPDMDTAQDIACALMVEGHEDYFIDPNSHDTAETLGHDEMMSRAHDAIEDTRRLAQKYAEGGK